MAEIKSKVQSLKSYLPKRKILVLIVLLVIIVLAFKPVTRKLHYWVDRSCDRASQELSVLVNSVIGIPYYQKPQYRNDSNNIVRLAREEWLNLPYYESAHLVDSVGNPEHLVELMPSAQEVQHADSLSSMNIWPNLNPDLPIYHKLCDHFLTCEALNIVVQDYVLYKPEILQNIIKIAERPCDYIRTFDEVKPGDEIVFFTDYTYMGTIFRPLKYEQEDIEYGIKRARKRLGCERKSFFSKLPSIHHPSIKDKKYVLIIINKIGMVKGKDQENMVIVVTRKDI
jgi:hypothetical protein